MVNDMEETKITYKIKKMRVGEEQRIIPARLYPVFAEDGEELYCVSADRKDLRMDIQTLLHGASRRPLRKGPRIPEVSLERNDYIYTRIACNVPDFHDQVETLIFNRTGCHKDELFAFDAEFLRSLFPNLKTVCCHDTVAIENASSALRVLDPFEVGEYSFELAKKKEIDKANHYIKMLWALDIKWVKFWCKVAREYNRKPVDHPDYDSNEPVSEGGMDNLFYVYFLGWYPKGLPLEEDGKVYVKKHKNFDKAIALLPIRFRNRKPQEVGEALFWDWQYMESDENPDYEGLVKVILATEKIVPDVRKSFYEAVQLYGCEESPSFLDLKQLLEGSNTKD